jgi:hypothetical protein
MSGRVIAVLWLATLPACNGNDVGNCPSYQPQGQWCWEGVTRDSCDHVGGELTSRTCSELGFGCPDVGQWNSPAWCIDHCDAANAHLAECGIAPLDCSESAALSHSSCVNACLTVGQCDQLQVSPLAACTAQCAAFVPNGGS